jgi:hypothetical protein
MSIKLRRSQISSDSSVSSQYALSPEEEENNKGKFHTPRAVKLTEISQSAIKPIKYIGNVG